MRSMDSLDTIEKISPTPNDDDQLREMVDDCNSLIDRYNSTIQSAAENNSGSITDQEPDVQALYLQIVNYKKKIEKIRMGY